MEQLGARPSFFLLRGTVALTLGRLFSVPNGTLVVGEGEHEFHIIACCFPLHSLELDWSLPHFG